MPIIMFGYFTYTIKRCILQLWNYGNTKNKFKIHSKPTESKEKGDMLWKEW